MSDAERKERIRFIGQWADYVKNHPDKDWSMQQKILIDSQIKNAKNYPLTKEQYLKIKSSNKK